MFVRVRFQEAAQALFYALMAGSQHDVLQDKAHEYLNRAEVLQAAGKQREFCLEGAVNMTCCR